jgi:hypothetical protein
MNVAAAAVTWLNGDKERAPTTPPRHLCELEQSAEMQPHYNQGLCIALLMPIKRAREKPNSMSTKFDG